MADPNPTVIVGPKPARVNDPGKQSTMVLSLTAAPPVPPSQPGMVVLRSRYARFRVQLSSPPPQLDPKTGRYLQPESLFIQFKNHAAVLNPEKNPADREKLELAKEHPNFGVNRAFWFAQDEIQKHEEQQVKEATAFLKARPELAQRVLEQLGGKTFELPARNLQEENYTGDDGGGTSGEGTPSVNL